MADPLYELLAPYFDNVPPRSPPTRNDATTSAYLTRLSTLSLSALRDSEPESLSQSSQSTLRSLQALSNRSYRSLILSAEHLSTLRTILPALALEAGSLHDAIPPLDERSLHFSQSFGKNSDSPLLERRKRALLLARNVDRISDVLDLPTLLSSTISSAAHGSNTVSTPGLQGPSTASSTANYGSALDLHAHIRRLHALYPSSPLVGAIAAQAEAAMQDMTTHLLASLRGQGVKLAGAMRTIGWLRRVPPELDEAAGGWQTKDIKGGGGTGTLRDGNEGALGAVFLVCRLVNLTAMLDALEPLRELADQETQRRVEHRRRAKVNGGTPPAAPTTNTSAGEGHQTERYLKRYLEIFREQSFAIISMYKSIFPSTTAPGAPEPSVSTSAATPEDPLTPLPPPLSSFPLHLVELLSGTLARYLPNVRDAASRESLLTQVLYCAGSLGRLGGDFGMALAGLEEEMMAAEMADEHEHEGKENGTADYDTEDKDKEHEWVEVMRKHRVLAGRLELLASGIAPHGGTTPPAVEREVVVGR